MKITAFNGSPWGQGGHSYIMTEEFLAGADKAGAETKNILLVKKEIKPCQGCGICFYKTPGKCVLKDDMSGLTKEFMDSDVAVLVTPLYIDNVTVLMKLFIERLMPILEPRYERDSNGECRRRKRFKKYPKLVTICSCALPEQSHFQVLQLFFRRMARTFHTQIVGEVYRSASGLLLLSKEELRFRPVVEEYKKLLQATGEEFVKTGKISEETTEKLREPIIDVDDYIEYANRMWNQMLPEYSLKVFG